MKIFVTGGQGQLARCVADVAHRHPLLTCICAGRPEFDLMNGPVARDFIIAAKPDIIVNTAAYTAVDKAENDVTAAFAVNRDGAAAVAEAATLLNVPVVHISTDYVFAGDKSSAYTELDAVDPAGVYGQSKLEGEEAVRALAPRHVILRTSWVYSVYGSNFVKTMLRIGREKTDVSVVDDQIGNPTSAHDLAEAIIAICQLAEIDKAQWGTYHAAGHGDVTWHGFARHIFDSAAALGFKSPNLHAVSTSAYPTPAKRPANSRLDCSKLRDVMGVELPAWQGSTSTCVQRLLGEA